MLNTNTVSIDELRSNLADIVNRVTYAKDRVVVKKYNREAAILISFYQLSVPGKLFLIKKV